MSGLCMSGCLGGVCLDVWVVYVWMSGLCIQLKTQKS